MLKGVEDISSTKKRLTIEIPAEVIESEIQRSLKDVQSKSQIPGFRQGKTPLSIIEKKYGKSVEFDVMERLVSEYYQKAVADAGLTPLSQPQVENSPDFARNIPISMTFTVEVIPDLQHLNYEGITVNDVTVEVTDEDVESALKNLAEEKSSYESVDEDIILGDLITVDYKTDFDDTISKDVVLKVGSGPYPQEFHEALLNKKKEQEFEFQAAFPEDMQSQFAGKTVKFNMTITDVKRKNISQIDDELAKDIGYDDLSILKDKVKDSLLAAKTRRADNLKHSQIMNKLLETYAFEVPESMLKARISDLIAEIRAMKNDDRPEEELTKEVLPYAEKAVRSFIIMNFIGDKEKIEVSEEEMKQKVFDIAQSYRMSPDDVVKYYLAKDGSLSAIKYSIFEEKIMSILLSKADVVKGE